MLPKISATLDDYPTPVSEPQWSASFGGYETATATIQEKDAKRLPTSVEQGSKFSIYTEDGKIRWQGRLATDPQSNGDGTYTVKATGHKARAEKESTPLRYQTRDYSKWADGHGDPHEFAPEADTITMEINAGSLRWRVNSNEALAAGDVRFATIWAEGTPLQRVAFDWAATSSSANFDFRIQRATGPSGARTNVADQNISAATGSYNSGTIASAQDIVNIGLRRNTAGTSSLYRVTLRNLRVWGNRTTADTFTGTQVLQDIATLAGFDSTGVVNLSTNVLPLWADEGESYADVMSYVCMIHDGWWRVLDDRGSGPYLEANTWANSKTWTVNGRGSHRTLAPMEKFNKVTVTYPSRSGRTRTTSATATVQALTDRGLTNVYPIELGDVQDAATLATTLATNVVSYLSSDRYEGTIDVVEAYDSAGRCDPYGILPGDLITITDWDQGQSKTLRVTGTTATPLGVTVQVGGDFLPVERLETLHGLQSARRRMAARVRPAKGPTFDFVGAQARLYQRMLNDDWRREGGSVPSRRSVNQLRRATGRQVFTTAQYNRRFLGSTHGVNLGNATQGRRVHLGRARQRRR